MNAQTYLQRLNYNATVTPTVATLQKIHLAHLYSVPFENLDIHLGRPIVLELDAIFEKIVRRRRGGFCYELNGLFAWLLQELGFKVTLLSASVAQKNGGFGPKFAHLTLRVVCPADPSMPSIPWLADVGWGNTFVQPLQLDKPHVEQLDGMRAYRIERDNSYYYLWQRNYNRHWERQYRFTLDQRKFTEFEPMCKYQQTSPQSRFTQHRICTLATPNGRISLDDQKLIITKDGQREQRSVSKGEYRSILENWFGIEYKE